MKHRLWNRFPTFYLIDTKYFSVFIHGSYCIIEIDWIWRKIQHTIQLLTKRHIVEYFNNKLCVEGDSHD